MKIYSILMNFVNILKMLMIGLAITGAQAHADSTMGEPQQKVYSGLSDQIDWPKFMARQDLVWDQLPRQWNEGAFVGNGLLGFFLRIAFCRRRRFMNVRWIVIPASALKMQRNFWSPVIPASGVGIFGQRKWPFAMVVAG
jgi:hypothetical protein